LKVLEVKKMLEVFKKRCGMLLLSLMLVLVGVTTDRAVQAEDSAGPGVSYYVDGAAGDDENSGKSAGQAWQTLVRVNRQEYGAGERILIKAGTRYVGQLAPKGSGEKGKPIIVDKYGEGARPRIDAEGKHKEALLLRNQDYWQVNNLELTNKGAQEQPYRYGVRVSAWDYGVMKGIELKNLYVHDVNGSNVKNRGEGHGILWEMGGRKQSRIDGLLIEGCHLVRTDRNGICGFSAYPAGKFGPFGKEGESWKGSTNVVIRNNLLEDFGGDGIKPWGCEGCVVEYNRLYKGRQRCKDYAAGIWPWACTDTVIQFNEVSEMKGTKDGQSFDSDGFCVNTVFQYNYSHDNDGGFMLICGRNTGTIIRYNISQNDKERLFHIAHSWDKTGRKNTEVYNNVFYVGQKEKVLGVLYTSGTMEDVFFRNNIFYADGDMVMWGLRGKGKGEGTFEFKAGGQEGKADDSFTNNVFFGKISHIPDDPGAIKEDPLLIKAGGGSKGVKTLEGYKLRQGSPCIRAGIEIRENGGRDFWGNPVKAGRKPDIGVHAYSGNYSK
jgi:hypothetical protein